MQATMHDIKAIVRDRLKAIRSLDRIVSSAEFEAMYDAASQEQRDQLRKYVDEADRGAIDSWIDRMSSRCPESMNVTELRQVARKLGVKDYNYLPKASLLSAIVGRRK